MKEFEIEKIETYRISAESEAAAMEILNDLDNSAATRVIYRVIRNYPGIRDRWRVTIEIDTLDGDPRYWDWSKLIGDPVKVTDSSFVERVLEDK